MSADTQGCVAGVGARRSSAASGDFIASLYFKQGTDLLRRRAYAEAETYLREVVRIWPGHGGGLNNLGTAVWQQGRMEEAEGYYRRALAEAPDDFASLNNLGNCLWEQSRPDDALEYYRRALRLRPDAAETQMNLGVALSDLGAFDEAMDWFRAALRLQPDFPEAMDNMGMAMGRLGRWDEALEWYERALAVRPDFPDAHRNRAFLWLTLGDYGRGWPEHEWRLSCRNHRGVPVRRPAWRGEMLSGRTILLHAEQGLGDVLQFIRFAAEARARDGRVIAAVPVPLLRLVARCPGVDAVQDWYAPLAEHDIQASLMSLPAILGTTLATLPGPYPYLSADPALIERWRPILEQSLAAAYPGEDSPGGGRHRSIRVGIVWQGNPTHRSDRRRSFPLELSASLAAIPGVRLVSLQKGYGVEQLDAVRGRFPIAVLPGCGPGEEDRRDVMDTAALMTLLDLVIAPDTSAAHLAGALGVPAWMPLPAVAEWRWMLDRDDSPYYPSLTLFRQRQAGDWADVFRRMADRLRDEADRAASAQGLCQE